MFNWLWNIFKKKEKVFCDDCRWCIPGITPSGGIGCLGSFCCGNPKYTYSKHPAFKKDIRFPLCDERNNYNDCIGYEKNE